MGLAVRCHYRAARRTPHLRPTTLSDRSCSCWIGFTRFPYSATAEQEEIDEEGSLLRGADLIGQLGDPHYLRKANALYYEFEEIGLNKQLGYESPSDLVDKYPQFYWNRISPYIQSAIRYLNVTSNGRRWIDGLYSNVFRAERDLRLAGPQS